MPATVITASGSGSPDGAQERHDLPEQHRQVGRGRFVPALATVREVAIEHTPPNTIFYDQSGRGGVDCDVLVEGADAKGRGIVAVIETKFVEPDFSTYGFRRSRRADEGRVTCPDDVALGGDYARCLYTSRKRYRYWAETVARGTLNLGALPAAGCPFAGPGWQLWVNHTLAHAEAAGRGAARAVYAVCAPAANDALLRGGTVLGSFAALVTDPATVVLMPLDEVIGAIAETGGGAWHGAWCEGLRARYAGI
ncbi:MAG TPA: hypothetical protein VGQ83_14460 [Polyangia bacterium]|jgi:hypothetical protein